MGAELRRIASLEEEGELKLGFWEQVRQVRLNWWQRGWTTMRIPRFAFASMLGLILLLSSGLVLVRARAGAGGGPVLMVTLKVPSVATIPPKSSIARCSFLTDGNPRANSCKFFAGISDFFAASIRFVAKEGERSQLGVKAKYENHRLPKGTDIQRQLDDVREEMIWIEPGSKQDISVPGLGNVEIAGEYLDHLPTLGPEETLDPQSGEFRIASPVLVRGREVVFNLAGTTVIGNTQTMKDAAVMIYFPGEGRYIISTVPFEGAVQAAVEPGQIKFSLDGDDYVLLTAMPTTRSEHVWVTHDPQYRLSQDIQGASGDQGILMVRKLSDLMKPRTEH
jgi:hypothetical protein